MSKKKGNPEYYVLLDRWSGNNVAIIKHDGPEHEAYFFKKVRQAIANYYSVKINDVHILTDKSHKNFSFSAHVIKSGKKETEEFNLSMHPSVI